ncbi:S-layer homology domain-containing protein [bacterium]|nr:S-layer homology domain-containing protein [bacterium]MBP9808698.1 S-layer homology domain-containing protein [bacterium]
MRSIVSLAGTVGLIAVISSLACGSANVPSAQAQFGGRDLSQIPSLLDVEKRRSDLDRKLSEALASGRLTSSEAGPFKQELLRLKNVEETYKVSGKFSFFQKARLTLELDVLSSNIEKSLHERSSVALTDLSGKKLDITVRLNEALNAGRLTPQETQSFKSQLANISAKESSYQAVNAPGQPLNSTQTLELALDLDRLSSALESQLRARTGEDFKFADRTRELSVRISDLVAAGRISAIDADGYRQELDRIGSRQVSMTASGRRLTTEDQLSLALDLERLNSKLERFTATTGGISGGANALPGINELQRSLAEKIVAGQSSGQLDAQELSVLKQEFDRIATVEASYRADGALSDNETLSLAGDLEKLSKRIDRSLTQAPTNTLASRQARVQTKLDQARANQRISEAIYQDLRTELERVAARERLYKADGQLSDSETLSLANDLEQISGRLQQSLSALPDWNSKRDKLSKQIEDALASGRLTADQADDFRRDLARANRLGSAMSGGNRQYSEQQVVAIVSEYDDVSSRLEKALAPLPDIAGKQLAITTKLNGAEASGALNSNQVSDLNKEFARIRTVENSFRNSDGGLNDWEAMKINRDLDALDSDLTRLISNAPVSSPVSSSSVPFDTKGHWAESYVGQLTQRGIIGGFPDGSFKPDDGITRAQFAAIAVKALNLPSASGPASFADVSASYWANRAIASVSQAGLVTGFPDGRFKPEDKITRAQALVILAKALPAQGAADTSILNSYGDGSSVPAWAAPSVAKAAKARILVSYPDPSQIKPNVNATRADVAALTYQTLNNLGKNLPQIRVGIEPQ